MTEREKHAAYLLAAELQFRLASAVRLATSLEIQPLDLPMEWSHGKHRVKYGEVALRTDQADYAAYVMRNSATHLMAVAVKDAICATTTDPKNSADLRVQAAYQIARMIRNAFAHKPFEPIWSIDEDCRDKVFEIKGIVRLDTTGLNGKRFDWRDYGGLLALFRLCRFVRTEILKDTQPTRKLVPLPKDHIVQFGELILKKVDRIPAGAIKVEPLPDGSIPLGRGYSVRLREEGE